MNTAPIAPGADLDVFCPLCAYNLRGLAEARCPECGAKFTWGELLDPARRKHPYLFEDHTERNVRSFLRTLIAGFLPRRFWEKLHPAQPSAWGRLVCYWLVCAGVYLAAAIAQLAVIACTYHRSLVPLEFNLATARGPARVGAWGFVIGIELLVWPWFASLALGLLRATVRQAQVRPIHLLRVTIYSGDVILWMAVILLTLLFLDTVRDYAWLPILGAGALGDYLELAVGLLPVLPFVMLLVLTWRLTVAIRRYLRFRHALATAIAVQVIFVLVAAQISVLATRK